MSKCLEKIVEFTMRLVFTLSSTNLLGSVFGFNLNEKISLFDTFIAF